MGVDLGPQEIHLRQPLLPLLLRHPVHQAGDLPRHVVEALAQGVDLPGPRIRGHRRKVASAKAVHGPAQARQRPRDLLALVQRHTQAQHQADPEDGEDQLIHPVQLSKDHIGRDLLYDGPAGILVQIVRQQIGLSLLADHGGAVGAIQGRHGLGVHKLLSQQLLVRVGNDIALLIVDIDLAAVGEHRLIEILQNALIHQHHKDALPVKLLQGLCHGELIARAVGKVLPNTPVPAGASSPFRRSRRYHSWDSR